MQRDHYRIQDAGYTLLALALCLMLVTACARNYTAPGSAANETAIAAAVQTVNASPASTNPPASMLPVVEVESFVRIIEFSGMEWTVKSSTAPVGPGPNYFSSGAESVWVDEKGQLHLKVIHKDGRWYCAEVVTADVLGYGTYQFELRSGAEQLDKYAVLGLFTWDNTAPQANYREIDIELARWGEANGPNAQFVVQPWDRTGNRYRFHIDPQAGSSTHRFVWAPERVEFLSFLGSAQSPDPQDIVEQWSYTGTDIPPSGAANARINLWLFGGRPPSDVKEIEVILSSFEFIPHTATK